MRHSRALVPIGLALLLLAGGLHADDQGTLREKKQRLERLKKEIQEERKKAHETAAKEAAAEATLKRIQEQLDKKTQELTALEANLKNEERALRELRQETTHTERELGEITERWASRLRALYKQGQYGVFRLLFSAESVTDMVRRTKYLKIITAQDRTLSDRYAVAVTDLGKKQTTLESRKAALEKSRNRIRTTEAAIADEKWRQRILLARLREEKEGYLTAVRELETVSGRLQDLINQLSKRAKAAPKPSPALPSGAFAAVKGKLPWPTSGDVASRFGRNQHPKFNTATFNKGVGIRAPLGQQIQVVHDGTVLYADWFRGYGKLVIVDHGEDFYSLYAHASDLLVQVGDAVRVGQPIGRVGETGSLEGPQLYFELRYRGEPQDPLAWLSPRP
ncbi:MAG: peptidoglycan DD-metalloendopeptidase family protein [candidate division NC10 bacterium]|nr:peptidoglycan DD-metalloendopeptidase family protein [candidate division NC10 bacterium]